jgi:Ni/Fe-hydrogenase subunit HybB-like protein
LKQFIVLIAMIALGIVIYQLVAGPGEHSILSGMGRWWEEMVLWRNEFPGENP